MLGLAAIPGLALAVGMLAVPETPGWLAARGERDRALAAARRVGLDPRELVAPEEEAASASAATVGQQWRTMVGTRWIRVTVLLAMLMGLTQQITGVNAIVYFAPTMMNKVGISPRDSVYTSIVIGSVSVIACWLGLKAVDRVGLSLIHI